MLTVPIMTADEILDHILSEFQTDKAGLASMLGVHKSTISNISQGYTKKISSKIAQRIVALRPEINYDFIIGKSSKLKSSDTMATEPNEVYLNTKGRTKVSVAEIATFMLNNIEAFEENEIFKVYKSSLVNQAKVELLQEQIAIKSKMKKES